MCLCVLCHFSDTIIPDYFRTALNCGLRPAGELISVSATVYLQFPKQAFKADGVLPQYMTGRVGALTFCVPLSENKQAELMKNTYISLYTHSDKTECIQAHDFGSWRQTEWNRIPLWSISSVNFQTWKSLWFNITTELWNLPDWEARLKFEADIQLFVWHEGRAEQTHPPCCFVYTNSKNSRDIWNKLKIML